TVILLVSASPGRDETWFTHQTLQNVTITLQLSAPQSAVGLVIDLYIFILPIIRVSGLQLSAK
ncbi:hypothetical protein K458DRAFT_320372, partial [Lentithecium fluviatile CBS 122367]